MKISATNSDFPLPLRNHVGNGVLTFLRHAKIAPSTAASTPYILPKDYKNSKPNTPVMASPQVVCIINTARLGHLPLKRNHPETPDKLEKAKSAIKLHYLKRYTNDPTLEERRGLPEIRLLTNHTPIPTHLKKSVSEKNVLHRPLTTQPNRPPQSTKLKSFSARTRLGKNPLKPNKVNQDSYFCILNFCGHKDMHFFGVLDGHGLFGSQASSLVKKRLPHNIENFGSNLLGGSVVRKVIFMQAFEKTHNEVTHANFDANYSGSTACTVLLTDDLIICANTGDSRAILGNTNSFTQISIDHKPFVKSECDRIIKANGKVEPFINSRKIPIGPYRVWRKGAHVPGLAMSRSLGDKVAHQVGVISEPSVIEVKAVDKQAIIVVASDGIWEVLSNEKVMGIVGKHWEGGNAEVACEELIEAASKEWNKKGPTADDITAIVIFLNY